MQHLHDLSRSLSLALPRARALSLSIFPQPIACSIYATSLSLPPSLSLSLYLPPTHCVQHLHNLSCLQNGAQSFERDAAVPVLNALSDNRLRAAGLLFQKLLHVAKQ